MSISGSVNLPSAVPSTRLSSYSIKHMWFNPITEKIHNFKLMISLFRKHHNSYYLNAIVHCSLNNKVTGNSDNCNNNINMCSSTADTFLVFKL